MQEYLIIAYLKWSKLNPALISIAKNISKHLITKLIEVELKVKAKLKV